MHAVSKEGTTLTDNEQELFEVLLQIPGFNSPGGVADEDQLKPADYRESGDQQQLLKSFPENWPTLSDNQLRECAAIGLKDAGFEAFKAITPDDVVAAFRKRREDAEFVASLKD